MDLPSKHHFLSWGSLISGFKEPILLASLSLHCPRSCPSHHLPSKFSLPLPPSAASSKHPLIPSAGSNLSFLQPPHFSLNTFTHTTLFFGRFPLSTFNFCYIFTFYLSYMCLNSLRAGSGSDSSFYPPIT